MPSGSRLYRVLRWVFVEPLGKHKLLLSETVREATRGEKLKYDSVSFSPEDADAPSI